MLALRPSRRADKRLLALAAVAAALSATASSEREAEASGYLTARFGSEHGTPATPNAFAIYFNPAALGGTTGTTLTGDVSLALRWVHYKRGADALSPSPNNRDALLADQTYVSANTGDANLLNLLALPFIGVNTDFGTKSIRAGYALYVPFGGLATWDKRNDLPGAPGHSDGVQRWHNIAGQILAVYNTFAFAYVIGDTGLSLGVSVSPVIHHVATVRARTADDSDDIYQPSNKALKEGRSYLDASGVNLTGSAGIYWQGLDENRLKLGLAYLAQPGFGETRLSGTLDGRSGAADVKQNIDFVQTYPDVIRLGGGYRLPGDQIELRSDFEFVRWSVFDKQCVVLEGKNCDIADNGAAAPGTNAADIVINIPRKWQNAVGYRAGVGYYATKELEIFGGAAFTTSAVPKATIDASTIDSFRVYGSLGARYEVSKHFAFAGSYNHIYFVPVNTNNANIFDTQEKPSKSPSADGKYNSQIGFLNVNVSYTF
jgi:long-chain fatty acid transport protein